MRQRVRACSVRCQSLTIAWKKWRGYTGPESVMVTAVTYSTVRSCSFLSSRVSHTKPRSNPATLFEGTECEFSLHRGVSIRPGPDSTATLQLRAQSRCCERYVRDSVTSVDTPLDGASMRSAWSRTHSPVLHSSPLHSQSVAKRQTGGRPRLSW